MATRAERRAWGSARTLAELGELVAQWLEGTLSEWPGYVGPVDVDESDAPGLTAALVALNRAGVVTYHSEAGVVVDDEDGRPAWYQCASIAGFAEWSTAERLRADLGAAGYHVELMPVRPRVGRARTGDVMIQLSRARIRRMWRWCSGEAIDALIRAAQVTVRERSPGRNELWTELERWAMRTAARTIPAPRV